MNRRAYALGMVSGLLMAAALWLATASATAGRVEASQGEAWLWADTLDAVGAAPDSHVVLLENDEVRVVRVRIPAGEKEPAHTHRNPSVMIVYQPTRIRYFGADGKAEFESPVGPRPASASEQQWMEPEGLHAVENVDTIAYEAYRIELKGSGR